LPDHHTVEVCQDKFASFEYWKKAGLTVPETIRVNDENDLKKAFKQFGAPIWIRAIISPGGGKGSFRAPDLAIAKAWIDYCEGWGNFVAAECLEEGSITWQSIWKDGKLVVAQGRKRLYWEFANRAPSGVTGITGTGVTVSDPVVDDLAQKAIFAIDKKPNGIFSVDFTFDKKGIPNPTEINIGRFFTTHFFFTQAGLNMPYIFVKAAFDEKIPELSKKINPLREGLAWVRGMDFHPILTDMQKIQDSEDDYKRRLAQLSKDR
jgi:Phosphoribosylaminoimidazole carboxylase (NCAIR synthetase)